MGKRKSKRTVKLSAKHSTIQKAKPIRKITAKHKPSSYKEVNWKRSKPLR